MRTSVQYWKKRFAFEDHEAVKRAEGLRFRASIAFDRGRDKIHDSLIKQAEEIESRLYNDSSETFTILMGEDEALEYIESVLRKSDRLEHDRKCAVTAFKEIYGKDITGVVETLGINVPEGYKLQKIEDKQPVVKKEEPKAQVQRCKATTKEGKPCRMKAVTPDGYCQFHAKKTDA